MRYGWTDDVVGALPVGRFLDLVARSVRAREQERQEQERRREAEGRDQIQVAAFLGWQIGAHIVGVMGGKWMPLEEYLRTLGVTDEQLDARAASGGTPATPGRKRIRRYARRADREDHDGAAEA